MTAVEVCCAFGSFVKISTLKIIIPILCCLCVASLAVALSPGLFATVNIIAVLLLSIVWAGSGYLELMPSLRGKQSICSCTESSAQKVNFVMSG